MSLTFKWLFEIIRDGIVQHPYTRNSPKNMRVFFICRKGKLGWIDFNAKITHFPTYPAGFLKLY